MSLFVDGDGHLRGWLAALLCCWAAVGDDEYELEKKNTKAKISRPTIYNDQPTQLEMMSPHASRNHPTWEHAGFTEEDRVRPITERPPSIKPLDFGDSSLMGKVSLHGRRKSSTTLLNFHNSAKRNSSKSLARTSIGQPTNFRRLEYTEKQRRSLKPLQLEPVVLRGDVLAIPSDHDTAVRHDASKSLDVDYCLATAAKRSSYRETRETPFERCQQMSATAKRDQSPTTTKDEKSLQSTLSTKSSSSSMYSLRRQPFESSTSNTPSSSRPSTERTRLKRKRSNPTTRIPSSESNDLDKEILELNTIVEERRAESTRPLSPEATQHVPAIAPSMTVRARSETLTDIGSAFSRPLHLNTDCPTTTIAETFSSPVKSRLSRPFTNMPDSHLETVGVVRRPSSRVTGWLTNLWSSSSSSSSSHIPDENPAPHQQPFSSSSPHSRHRALSSSETTSSSSLYCTSSMSTTTSYVYSKPSVTPPSTACTSEEREREKVWLNLSPSQVGLAL